MSLSIDYSVTHRKKKMLWSSKQSVNKPVVITYFLIGCITIAFVTLLLRWSGLFSDSSLVIGAGIAVASFVAIFICLMMAPPVKNCK